MLERLVFAIGLTSYITVFASCGHAVQKPEDTVDIIDPLDILAQGFHGVGFTVQGVGTAYTVGGVDSVDSVNMLTELSAVVASPVPFHCEYGVSGNTSLAFEAR